MFGISEAAKNKLTVDQAEFINMLGGLRGENIYRAGLTIAAHSKLFDMFFNNEFNCEYLSELILCNENPIVNTITADYILKEYNDLSHLKEFAQAKIDELHPQ